MAITSNDWIQLSAHVDGELNRREQDILEKRLKSDPQLQSALDQLRMTRAVLRSTPGIETPRNFTITPEMVRSRTRRSASVSYRLAAAVMSFVLIGVLVVDFGRFLLGGAMAPAAPRMEEVMQESAAKEVTDTSHFDAEGEVNHDRIAAEPGAEAPAEEILIEEEALANMAEPVVAEEDMAESEIAAEGIAESEVAEDVEGVGEEAVGEYKSSPDGDLQATEIMGDDIERPAATGSLDPTITRQPQATAEVGFAEDYYYRAPWYSRIPVFRIIELLLFLGVIGFATAAWVKRRE